MIFDSSVLFAFVSFAFVASITPGPNNIMVMASGAAFGMRATLPHVAGIALGFAAMLSIVMLGLGTFLERVPVLLSALKWGGVIWLCFLAWRIAKPAILWTTDADDNSDTRMRARAMTLIEAALFQWINPKAWSMAVAVTGAYSDLAEQAWQRAVVMSATFLIIAPVCNGTWLVVGRGVRALLSDDFWGRLSLLTMAGLIVLSACLIILS